MCHPTGVTGSTGTGDQAVLEGPVLPLDHAVALGMVRGGELACDAQGLRELTPKIAGELPSAIRDNCVRGTKPGNPVTDKGAGTRLGRDVGQRNGLQPAGITIDDRKEVGLTFRFRERANKVQMKGRKTSVRHFQGRQWGPRVTSYLGALAREAGASKGLDIGGHPVPDIAASQVPKQGIPTSVCQIMHGRHDQVRHGRRHQRPRGGRRQRGVAEQGTTACGPSRW